MNTYKVKVIFTLEAENEYEAKENVIDYITKENLGYDYYNFLENIEVKEV